MKNTPQYPTPERQLERIRATLLTPETRAALNTRAFLYIIAVRTVPS